MGFTTIDWNQEAKALILLDQTRLPGEVAYETCTDYMEVADAITQLKVRGAPAIGVTAAYGVVVGVCRSDETDYRAFSSLVDNVVDQLAATRPTAVNLFWALDRMRRVVRENHGSPVAEIKERLLQEARDIQSDDERTCRQIGEHGQALLQTGQTVLTHCNAGALATSGAGTALAVVYHAHQEGKQIHVYAGETRPVLQGSRLTTWELSQQGIATTLICDNMAAQVMKEGKIDCIIVGADRIASNGDVANKIGTYGVAVLAYAHDIPFYVAAPFSSIDLSIDSGQDIPIEERDASEVYPWASERSGKISGERAGEHTSDHEAPMTVEVYNPAFDVTPAQYVSAIITEQGVARQPYKDSLSALSQPIQIQTVYE